MIIDGEKWACDACVRGHRVSNCQHYARPLQHINKKGRPVTQCQHCRSQRKNRSAHVKCDCGEKTTKCVHLGAIKGHRESCCCNHGGACTCAMKRDLDTVPETSGPAPDNADNGDGNGSRPSPSSTSPTAAPAPNISSSSAAPARGGNGGAGNGGAGNKSPVRRRRANTTRSESTLSLDEHTRNKCLSQKHTRVMSQKSRPSAAHRIHGARSSGNLPSLLLARRATDRTDDDLGDDDLSSGHGGSDSGLEEDGTTSPPALDTTAASTTGSGSTAETFYAGQYVSQQQQQQQQERRARSETASPLLFANGFPQAHQLSDNLNPISPLSPLNLQMALSNSYAAYGGASAFSPEQADQPLISAGLNTPSIDWSQLGLAMMDRGLGGVEADSDGLPQSTEDSLAESLVYGGSNSLDSLAGSSSLPYDFNGSEQAPTLTTATSGEVSEAEDSILAPGLDDYDYDYDFESGTTTTTDGASSSVAFSRVNSGFHLSAAAASAVPAVLMARSGSGKDSFAASGDFGGEASLRFVKSEAFLKSESEFLAAAPQTAAGEELAVLAMAGAGGLSRLPEDDTAPLWMADYSALPAMAETTDPDALFWAGK